MSRQYVLPNTGLEVNIPSKIFKTAVRNFDQNTKIVDEQVNTSVEDVLLKKDVCKAKAFELIGKDATAELQ
jgi:hypothetical protein